MFTHNNADSGWRPQWDRATMAYLVWEVETAPTTGRRHIQGYVRMRERRTIAIMKIILNDNTLHLETAKGSEYQNRLYCTKEEGERGEEGDYDPEQGGRQGRRTDIEQVTAAIKEGMPLAEVATTFSEAWIKYHSGLTSLALLTGPSPPTRRSVTTTVLWGSSGVGKSHRVRTTYPEAFIATPGRDPFGSYLRQEVLVFEEFEPDSWPIRKMNLLLDVWSCELDSRYHNKKAWWNKVFILSNSPSSTWYPLEAPELKAAFARRLTYEIEIKDRNQEILLV